jgi:hypothetical protein
MANQLYGYNTSSYGAAPAAAAATSSLSSVYDSRSLSDRTILRYIGSDPSTTKYSLSDPQASWPSADVAAADPLAGIKRPSEG